MCIIEQTGYKHLNGCMDFMQHATPPVLQDYLQLKFYAILCAYVHNKALQEHSKTILHSNLRVYLYAQIAHIYSRQQMELKFSTL